MADEQILNSDSSSVIEDSTPDYLTALQQLKESTVDRSKYEALRAENKKLIDAVVNGSSVDVGQPVQKESVEELRNKLFNTEHQTNLEYIDTALKLREAILEEGGNDIFVPDSSQYSPTANDIATAQKVAAAFQSWVDEADGDPEVFRNCYIRGVKDVNIRKK